MQKNKKSSGRRMVRVSTQMLLAMGQYGAVFPARKGEQFRVSAGLPPDARIVAAMYDARLGVVEFIVESPSWEPAPGGQPMPEVHIDLTLVESRIVLPS